MLVTAQGIGAVAMALAMGPLAARFGIRRVLLAMMSLLPFALGAYAYAPTLAASALAILIVGALVSRRAVVVQTVVATPRPGRDPRPRRSRSTR